MGFLSSLYQLGLFSFDGPPKGMGSSSSFLEWVMPGMVNELREALKVGIFLEYVCWERTGRACVSHEQDRWLREHLGHRILT